MTILFPSSPRTQTQGEQASCSKPKRFILKGKVSLEEFTTKAQLFQKDLKDIKQLNQNWINELPDDHPEKATRLEVAKIIEDCFIKKEPNFYIMDKKFTSLPKSFEKLQHLKRIFLYNNNLETFPKNFIFPDLMSIQVTDNHLSEIPDGLHHSKKLEVLNFANNHIKEFPDSFEFPELFYLHLGGNHLKSLPDTLSKSQKLFTLIGRYNDIEGLPESWSFPKLSMFAFEGTQLKTLYPNLHHSKDLQCLYLDDTPLTHFPENCVFSNLKEFSLYNHKNLKNIPFDLSHSTQLEKLRLKGTKINYYNIPENIRTLENIDIDIAPEKQNIMGQYSSHTTIIEDTTQDNLKKSSTYLSVEKSETDTIISDLIETFQTYLKDNSDNPDYKTYDKNECQKSQERLGTDEAQEGYTVFYKNDKGDILGGELKSIKKEITKAIDKTLAAMKKNTLQETNETVQIHPLEKEIRDVLQDIIHPIAPHSIKETLWNALEEKRQNRDTPESIYDITEYFVPTQSHKMKTALRFLTHENTHFHSSKPITLKGENVTLKQLIAGTLKFIAHPDTQWAEKIAQEDKKDIIYHNLSDILYQIQRNDNFIPTDKNIVLDDATQEDKPRCHSASINLLTLLYHPFLKLSASLPLSTEYSADFTKKGKKIIKDIFSGEIPHNLAYDAITQSYNQKEITPELWGIANDDGTGMGIASLVRTSLREDYDRLRFLTQKTPLQIRLIDKNSEDGKTLGSVDIKIT